MKLSRWVKGVLIGIYFVALAIVVTYPLINHLATRMIGQTGDNIYFVWLVGWFKKALFEMHVNPFNTWFLNYPAGWSPAYTEIAPLQLFIAMPFALLVNPLFGYNISMLSTYVLAGVFMFLWVEHLTGKAEVALVAGTAFAMLPYHQAHFLIGHLNIAGIQWFPLYFWGLFEILKPEPASKKWKFGILAGAALGLIALTSMYYLYMTLLVTALIFLVNVFFVRKTIFQWQYWVPYLWMGIVAIPLITFAVWPFLSLENQVSMPVRDVSVARLLAASASPLDYLLPSTDHFLWGKWVMLHFNRQLWNETTLFVGFSTLVIAGVGVFALRKRNKKLIVLIIAGILFAWVLSLGLDLFWNGERLLVKIPAFLVELLQRSETTIPLPGLLLYKTLPYFDKMRSFARFGIYVMLFLQVLMAFGLSTILSNISSKRMRIALILIVLCAVWIEFCPGVYSQTSSADGRPVDHWLAKQPGDGAVIQFPFEQNEEQELVYATLIHGKPFVGGAFSSFPPQQYQQIMPVMQNFPDTASTDLMDELGLVYILVDQEVYGNTPAFVAECESYGLQYVDTMGDELVFINQGD